VLGSAFQGKAGTHEEGTPVSLKNVLLLAAAAILAIVLALICNT
jgi:hypothetical protein